MFYVGSIGIHKKLNERGFRITYPTKKVGDHSMAICHPMKADLSKEIEREICLKAQELLDH
jgi:stage V sporulation protein G